MASSKYYVLCASFLLSSCAHAGKSHPPIIESEGYKVSVSVDGKSVKNFDEQLIHRIQLSTVDLSHLISAWQNRERRPIRTAPVADTSSIFMGLQVTAVDLNPNLPALGFQVGDRITAIGNDRKVTEDSLAKVFDETSVSGEGSLTIERNYRPHKLIYYVTGQSARKKQ